MTAVCLKITKFRKTDVLPFLVPLFMYIVGDKSLLYTIFIWFWIISCASFHFGLVGLNAAHHHPNIFHDGDTPRFCFGTSLRIYLLTIFFQGRQGLGVVPIGCCDG